jgi:hypothetical protein
MYLGSSLEKTVCIAFTSKSNTVKMLSERYLLISFLASLFSLPGITRQILGKGRENRFLDYQNPKKNTITIAITTPTAIAVNIW